MITFCQRVRPTTDNRPPRPCGADNLRGIPSNLEARDAESAQAGALSFNGPLLGRLTSEITERGVDPPFCTRVFPLPCIPLVPGLERRQIAVRWRRNAEPRIVPVLQGSGPSRLGSSRLRPIHRPQYVRPGWRVNSSIGRLMTRFAKLMTSWFSIPPDLTSSQPSPTLTSHSEVRIIQSVPLAAETPKVKRH